MKPFKGYLLIKQIDSDLILIAKFLEKDKAIKALSKYRKNNPLILSGVVSLINIVDLPPGFPTIKTKSGDLIYFSHIDWRDSAGWDYNRPCGVNCCSECCDGLTPKTLDYKCPIWNSLCGCVGIITGKEF